MPETAFDRPELGRVLRRIVLRPGTAFFVALALVLGAAAGLVGLSKDPSVDAFVPDDHPASIARDKARDVFGLEDPIIVGLAAPSGESAFTVDGLSALRAIDHAVRQIDGVKKNDVVSLASENAMRGANGDLIVETIVEDGRVTPATAAVAWQRFRSMPMLSGLLASENGDFLTLIVPVEDPNQAEEVVANVERAAQAAAPPQIDVHVAGVASMNARLAEIVNGDTRIFVPAAGLTVLAILLLALRRPKALLGPFFVIAGSAAASIGLMGWFDAKYYLITTALPVVIMAIAVADTLHITTHFLKARAENRHFTAQDAVLDALSRVWLPVTLTSITTIAAFLGLSFGAAMQPISEFGYFAAIGSAVAWALSLTALPAILIMTDLKPADGTSSIAHEGPIDRMVASITETAFSNPRLSLAAVASIFVFLGFFALRAEFDYERQRYFAEGDTVKLADQEINDRLGGVNFLDVVVTAPEEGGLMTPQAMSAIAELRDEMQDLPLVVKVGGIDEYMALMHEVLTDAPAGTLPTEPRAPAQYMFLYETSGAPEDFKQEIDYTYSSALIRAQVSTDSYARTLPTVHKLETIASAWSSKHDLSAEISGRVAVNDGWMTKLSENHFVGLGMAFALVFMTTLMMFRSLVYALFAMVPVAVGVISVYAAMGLSAISIAPATSMTAAIATGLGVDFGIHLISLVRNRRAEGATLEEAFSGRYTVVAKACFYSAIALGCALMVVCLSSAPPLRWFGLLVALGAFGSLIGAILIVPALWASILKFKRRTMPDALPT
ncbi:efflux RND transporter permease subunit [Altererythrobacter sp. MF3-039]|uniref:efflux RND transporter permease subunit n=1 Tax=Altererythrobacter sp. MF3-039 TaxID=3252901 RepID=UPI00390C4003